ncbi:hypothetical protein JYU34_021099 [Plutella xylostella]|uniref:Uncharacterized protein n=1 Tax=Plutella xylostella TaxID=51655 RepID=A0ABQ7PSX5_PLUXY|nr:hypothetical protein JYU34_021099 [Plutella xylostella]
MRPGAGPCSRGRTNVTKRHSEMFETTFMARKKVAGRAAGATSARRAGRRGGRGRGGGSTVGQRAARQSHAASPAPPAAAARIPSPQPSEFIHPRHRSALPAPPPLQPPTHAPAVANTYHLTNATTRR